ncbi:MAG: NADH-quinone oxidoreductase subunit NuoN [Acidiferrobacteraceae bacterium]
MNFMPALPLIVLFGSTCAILLIGLYVGERRTSVVYVLSQVALITTVALVIRDAQAASVVCLHGMFVRDRLSDLLDIAICLLVVAVFVYSRRYLSDRDMYRTEYFVLALFGVVGMMVINSAAHFLSLYLGLELMALSLYAMVAFQRDSARATEAAMKYFVLGALASGMLLYGMSMLYGVTGSLSIAKVASTISAMPPGNIVLVFGLVFVIVGLLFKIGAVPFHMWIPDVYDGAPTVVTLYIGTAPKVAALALILRLLVGGLQALSPSWREMLVIAAFLSMGVGNVVAISQTNLKRMLAYSAIAHMGFALLGLAAGGREGYADALFYLLIYSVMSLGAFGLVALLSGPGREIEYIDDLKGLSQRNPWIAFLMLLLMFAMAGVPPTAGFYAKLAVIQAAVDAHLIWLAVAAVLFSVVGAYYYLRVVKVMYFDAPEDDRPFALPLDGKFLFGLNGLSMLLLTPWIGTIIAFCHNAIQGLP